MPAPVILVTGASSGIGRLVVDALAPHAAAIAATSRTPASFPHSNVAWLAMDVRDPVSIQAAVDRVLAEHGRIDVVVNNAGLLLTGLIEETAPEQARALFDTNFWGVVEVTRQVLPPMRAQRRGQVIIIGSLAGRVGTPGQGFYAAAKFALAGYAQALAGELASFGIDVHLVEPGFHRTGLHQNAQQGTLEIADYQPLRARVQQAIADSFARGEDPRHVATCVEQLVLKQRTGLRHPVGRNARWVPRLQALLPQQVFLRALRRKFGLA